MSSQGGWGNITFSEEAGGCTCRLSRSRQSSHLTRIGNGALAGFSARRSLPKWRADVFRDPPGTVAGPRELVLFADTFNRYFERENIDAALAVLGAGGYMVHVATPVDGVAESSARSAGRLILFFTPSTGRWSSIEPCAAPGPAPTLPSIGALGAGIGTMSGSVPDFPGGGSGKDGAFHGMGKGTVFVDHTTASAEIARELYDAAKKAGIPILVDAAADYRAALGGVTE